MKRLVSIVLIAIVLSTPMVVSPPKTEAIMDGYNCGMWLSNPWCHWCEIGCIMEIAADLWAQRL